MERVTQIAWLFNGDFEDRLFSGNFKNILSTKITQEFEYFLALLDPDKTIFTSKKYSNEFLNFFESFTGKALQTTPKAKEIIPWCASYENIEILKKLQLKENVLAFIQDEGLLDERIEFVKKVADLEEGYLYKYSKSLSGGGHLKFPLHKTKIEKLINNGEVLVKEKILNRVLDFSTLVDGGEIIARYENIVDEYFQYKGTIITDEEFLSQSIQEEYEKVIPKILNFSKDHHKVMSIDSFVYNKRGEGQKLFPACEINARKTMGYFAFKFKEKYFPNSSHMKIRLFKNPKKDFSRQEIEKHFANNCFCLSPFENRFLVFALVAESREKLERIEGELLSTFF